jgi:hypothetical protein
VGDRAIEIDHGRGRRDARPVIERGDPRPVGIGGPVRAGVAGGERGLQHIGAVAAQRLGASQRIEAPAVQQMVPTRAILLGEQYEGAVRPGARSVARRLDLHQGEEAEHIGILGHQRGQHAAEPLRLQAQARPDKVVARRGRIAFIENEVDDLEAKPAS